MNVLLVKVALDAGNGSSKGILHNVNVKDKQSLKHVLPWFEFSGKDSYENMRIVVEEAPTLKQDVEDIMHRRCILLIIAIDEQVQTVVVKTLTSSTIGVLLFRHQTIFPLLTTSQSNRKRIAVLHSRTG